MQTISLPFDVVVPATMPGNAEITSDALRRGLVNGLILRDEELIEAGEVPDHPIFDDLANCCSIFSSIMPGDDIEAAILAEIMALAESGALDHVLLVMPSSLRPHMFALAAAYIHAAGWIGDAP